MQDLNDLYYFVQVVEHAGFAPAGRALNQPKSKLSRRIAQLEESLGVRLLQRSTRRFAVTEIGQEYYRHCRAMLVEAEAAQEVIARSQAEPQGVIRLSCAPAMLYFQIGDMVARFMALYPQVQVIMDISNRRVDVIRENIDVAVRVRFPPLEDSDLVMKVLALSPQRLLAHPQLMAGRPPLLDPAELADLPSLGLGLAQDEHRWCLESESGESRLIPYRPRLIANDMVALRDAALQGVGLAQLPTMMAHEALLSGRLVDVMPGWQPRSGIVHLAFPSRRGLLPSVRRLIDFLADEFAAEIAAQRGYEAP